MTCSTVRKLRLGISVAILSVALLVWIFKHAIANYTEKSPIETGTHVDTENSKYPWNSEPCNTIECQTAGMLLY